jgi:hypothetical protein
VNGRQAAKGKGLERATECVPELRQPGPENLSSLGTAPWGEGPIGRNLAPPEACFSEGPMGLSHGWLGRSLMLWFLTLRRPRPGPSVFPSLARRGVIRRVECSLDVNDLGVAHGPASSLEAEGAHHARGR